METLRFTVEEGNKRVDAFLVERVAELSKNGARELCDSGKVHLNGRIARSGDSVASGDVVEVEGFLGKVEANPASLDGMLPKDFAVLFEDEHLLVVAKPRKMASEPFSPRIS